MKITLYSESDCPDCIEIKKALVALGIEFENKDLMEKSTNLMNQFPNKWEHLDMIKDYEIPPWIPTVVILDGDKKSFVCTSNKTGNKGNIYIGETPEQMIEHITKIIGNER